MTGAKTTIVLHLKNLELPAKYFVHRPDMGATSEYPATHALLKSTATVVRGPQSTSKVKWMY